MLSSVPGWKWHRGSASASASPTVLACLPPDKQLTRYVVDRATVWLRRRYQDDDRYRHSTEPEMLEQVCGVESVRAGLGDGWLVAGRGGDGFHRRRSTGRAGEPGRAEDPAESAGSTVREGATEEGAAGSDSERKGSNRL